MEITVEPSKTYAVTTSGSCTVTDADGLELCTASSGSQAFFVATTPTVTVSDDGAKVSRATFNYALAVAGLLGGGADKLPAGYTRLDYLESTGSQYIQINKALTLADDCEFTYKAQNTGGEQWQHAFGTRVTGNTAEFGVAYNTTTGTIRPCLGATFSSIAIDIKGIHELKASARTGKVAINGTSYSVRYSPLTLDSLGVFRREGVSDSFFVGRIFEVSIFNNGEQFLQLVPALDPTGIPCMYDLVTREPFRNVGSGQFVAGMTLAQVRGLRLPDGGGKLTLALPHEASIDRQAQAALERERANGWELELRFAEAEVPAGYRKLEYLESTGSQYIQIKKALTLAEDCEFTYKAQNTGGEEWQHAFGTRVTANTAEFGVVYNTLVAQIRPCLGAGFAKISTDITAVHEVKASARTGKVAINGTSYSVRYSPLTLDSLGVFRREGVSDSFFVGRIFEVSIFNNGEQFLQLVPALDPAGKPCMYDRVSGTAYQGVGTFAAGLATVDAVRNLWLPATGGSITLSVPHDTPDSAVAQLRTNYPNWQIAIRYRES